jgi:hypothetical protein
VVLLCDTAAAAAAAAAAQTFESQQVASDCLWSDPAKEDQEVNFNSLNMLLKVSGHVNTYCNAALCTANTDMQSC